ncbi:MAG: TRAP transporter large permease [Deltaproteobacteria bacterium]|nr:TRAP transporter large permease [Deltaproteobacteria bacterium]
MSEVNIGLLGLCVLLVFFATGIELGFAMALVGFLGFAYTNGLQAAANLLARDLFEVITNYGYSVFPLFILMGQIGFNAGIAARLYDAAHKFIGHVPGGLAMATVLGATAFKTICGSSAATSATFASVAIPEMRRFGYSEKLSAGVVAIVGTLGVIIPPSVTLIILGIVMEQSIGQLFLAGIIPGLLIAALFMGIIYVWAKIDPKIAPRSEKYNWRDRIKSLPEVFWVLVVFLLIIGGIAEGFFTPTEAASVGAFGVLLLAWLKKDITLKKYYQSLRESLRTAIMLLMLVYGSTVFGHFIAVTNIPQIAADWVGSLNVNRYLIMIIICLIYELGGSFIDDLAFLILATPIFYPVAMKLGFHPLWFGIVIGVVAMIGVVIPPVAICVFVVKNITKIPMGVIYKGVLPFLISLVMVWILLFVFPEIVLWLPSRFFNI